MLESILYIVLAIIGFFVFVQVYFFINSYLKKGKKIEAFGGEIGKKVSSGKKLLLYFYSPTCGPCKAMTPVIDKMSKENKDIHKINLSRDMTIGRIFGVMGTPATVVVENSRIKKYVLGARPESYLRGLIEN